MKNKLAKLIEVLPWLSLNPGVSAAETAAHFGISQKELLDLLQLAVFTGPGQGGGELVDIDFEDEDSLFVVDAKGLERPIKFTPETTVQIIGGLNYLLQLPELIETEVVENLLLKFQKAMALPIQPIEIVPDQNDEVVGKLVGQAITENRATRIRYVSATTGAISERVIEPKSVIVNENIRYIKAWCNAAIDFRLFRIDRIAAIELLDRAQVNAAPPSSLNEPASEQQVANSQIVTLGCTKSASLEFDPRLIRSESTEPSGDLKIELEVYDLEWIAREIMASSGEIWPIGPTELVTLVQQKVTGWKSLNSIG